jgi:hypothetical protein
MQNSDRYLNLATINLGEAIVTLGNVRQQGHEAGASEYNTVKHKLTMALAALEGKAYEPPPDQPDIK